MPSGDVDAAAAAPASPLLSGDIIAAASRRVRVGPIAHRLLVAVLALIVATGVPVFALSFWAIATVQPYMDDHRGDDAANLYGLVVFLYALYLAIACGCTIAAGAVWLAMALPRPVLLLANPSGFKHVTIRLCALVLMGLSVGAIYATHEARGLYKYQPNIAYPIAHAAAVGALLLILLGHDALAVLRRRN